jgi:hypothetical protein
MSFYVYALIDPTNENIPFYIGKGNYARTEAHFREVADSKGTKLVGNNRLFGERTESVLQQDAAIEVPAKTKKIRDLAAENYGHQHIARIIARDLDESSAFALEAFLIKTIYGIGEGRLLNRVEGQHSERFRPRESWGLLPGFDSLSNVGQLDALPTQNGKPFYVYVLMDPANEMVFYVGKGTGNRLAQHFSDAVNNVDNGERNRLNKLRDLLLTDRRKPNQIGHVVAHVETEKMAYDIEALLISFVYGTNNLTNIRRGHRWETIRHFGDWEPRVGLDLSRIVNPDVPQDRDWLKQMLIADGLGVPLDTIRNAFPEIHFAELGVLDSGELGIEADVASRPGVAGTRIKIFTRRSNIQIELRPRSRDQKEWMIEHFTGLEAERFLRKDRVFLPSAWKGSKNMSANPDIAIQRVRLLLDLIAADGRAQLSDEAKVLISKEAIIPTFVLQPVDAKSVDIAQEDLECIEGDSTKTKSVDDFAGIGDNRPGDPIDVQFPDGSENHFFVAVSEAFPEIDWTDPGKLDSGEIGIQGDVGFENGVAGVRVKVFLGKKLGAQAELRWRNKYQNQWIYDHFITLYAEGALRHDRVFLPVPWKGRLVATEQGLIDRVALLCEIVMAGQRNDLSNEAVLLLEPRPTR